MRRCFCTIDAGSEVVQGSGSFGAKLAFTFQNIAVYTREVFFHDVPEEPLVDRDDDAYQLAAVGDGQCLTGAGGLPDHRPGQFADPDRLGFQLGRAGRVV